MSSIIKTSVNNITKEFEKHCEYKENYEALMCIPLVRRLMDDNEELQTKVRRLTEALYELSISSVSSASKSCMRGQTAPPSESVYVDCPKIDAEVFIKTEPEPLVKIDADVVEPIIEN